MPGRGWESGAVTKQGTGGRNGRTLRGSAMRSPPLQASPTTSQLPVGVSPPFLYYLSSFLFFF